MERGVEVFESIDGSRHGEGLSIPVGQANWGGCFWIDVSNFKSLVPAGQASGGHCHWLLQDKPARGLCIALL